MSKTSRLYQRTAKSMRWLSGSGRFTQKPGEMIQLEHQLSILLAGAKEELVKRKVELVFAQAPKIDPDKFENMTYKKAKSVLQTFRQRYITAMDTFRNRNNAYLKDRLDKLQYDYETQLEQLEASLAARPEAKVEEERLARKLQRWDEKHTRANLDAIATMRDVFKYNPQTGDNLFERLDNNGVQEVIASGFNEDLVDRALSCEVLRFCVMLPDEIAKIYPSDFINKYRFEGFEEGYELDLVELRAIYVASEAIEESSDSDNARRLEWRERLRKKLFKLAQQEKTGELDIETARNICYWEREDVTTLQKLLRYSRDREDFEELKPQLEEKEKKALDDMMDRISKMMSQMNTADKRKRLERKIKKITAETPEAKMKRDMLEAELEETASRARRTVVNKMLTLSEADPRYLALFTILQ